MKRPRVDIVNLLGISLIVVALVSAGGLYYTAKSYADISETFATVSIDISEVKVFRDNSTGQVTIDTIFHVENNRSNLDIEIYRTEYGVNVDVSSTDVMNYDRYVGSGSRGSANNTVMAGKVKDIQVTTRINPDTIYMDRFEQASVSGNLYMFIDGTMWYRIARFPEASQRIDGIFFMGSVVVQDG